MISRISIIVPAHNAEATLQACLDSLLQQNEQRLEILVIDDGSTDATAAVGADFAARDPRVRILHLPENQGVSAARNLGLSAASGQYIGFCDADDWAEPAMYGALADAADAACAQIAFCPVVKDFPQRSLTVPLPWPGGTVLDTQAIRTDLVPCMISLDTDGEELPLSGYTPRNLFAREVIGGLWFLPDIHYAEDLLFIVAALLRAERAAVVSIPLYHYRFHSGSATQRYSRHIPASHAASQEALRVMLAEHHLLESLSPRLAIRARRNVLGAIINVCLPGTPYPPLRRIGAIRALIADAEVHALFRQARLDTRSRKQALKYWLIRHRLATPLMLLYSYAYRAR